MSDWVHLTTAPDQITGEIWVSILRDAGLRAMIRPSDAVSFLGVSASPCRVQVMDEDLARAREVLAEVSDEPGDESE
jgi:hypothetical protein